MVGRRGRVAAVGAGRWRLTDVDVVILGAGFGGVAAAIRLAEAGRSFLILEKAQEIGGTWRENTYPGAACDVQSHLYSLSFEPHAGWSRRYAGHAEIQAYLLDVVARRGLRPHIRFGAEAVGGAWDGAAWTIRLADGGSVRARFVVLATGPLHKPSWPEQPGLDRFRGRVFHSAAWDHSVDLRGVDVVSIGTGASAIQYVPEIAPRVRRLSVLQRSAAWVIPRDDRAYRGWERALFAALPLARRAHREALYWRNEVRVLAMRSPPAARWVEGLIRRHVLAEVGDPALAARLTPDYTLGCKRVLVSNTWYKTFLLPHVDLVTSPLVEVEPEGVRTADGARHPADVIVLGTGFVVDPRRYMRGLELRGVGGQSLLDAWADLPVAHRGTMVAGFPNLFTLLGPNTGLGHNSVLVMVEAQLGWMLQAMALSDARGGGPVAPRPEAQDAYNQWVQAELQGTVWSSGCRSWYLSEDGRNYSLWPGSTWTFRRQLARLDPSELTVG